MSHGSEVTVSVVAQHGTRKILQGRTRSVKEVSARCSPVVGEHGPHEGDVALHLFALRAGGGKLGLERGDAILEFSEREQAIVTFHGVVGEVRDRQQAAERKQQRPGL